MQHRRLVVVARILSRDELGYILDSPDVMGKNCLSEIFRALKNNEIREFGEFRTWRLALEGWDRWRETCADRMEYL